MAYVLSSISGNLISAASAGYAPTNGPDVSAIASAYQVVSATATQLNAGTAYVTSINETQLSAARAGNAANATQATSAWYDGTGRLISSLPDSAAVSGIASAYAESAASGKEDAITYGYDTSNAISSINGSALAGGGGGGVVTATAAGTYASAGILGLPVYTTAISSVNNSSLIAAYASMANTDTKGNSISSCISEVSSNSATWNKASSISSVARSYAKSAASSKLDKSASSDFYSTSNPSGFLTAAYTPTFGYSDTAISSIDGSSIYALFAQYDSNSRALSKLCDGATVSAIASAYADSAASSKLDSTATGDFYSTSNPSGFIAGVDLSDYATTTYVDSSVSGKLDSTAFNSGDFYSTSNPSGFISGVNLDGYATTSYVESSVSSKADSSALSSYALSADVSGTVDIVSSQSANWGGSALALSAGPGVKLEKVGDTLVASTDETVLWSGSGSAFTTTEPLTNFSEIKFHVKSHASANVGESVVPMVDNNRTAIKLSWADDWNKGAEWLGGLQWWSNLSNTGMTSFAVSNAYYMGLRSGTAFGGGSYGTNIYVLDVIGVGRTAGV